ncbi:hypothetical protein [Jiulongibacter sp. NS-SX5]|uniref:hypothetical protein n=1 Tax=Jiulongibacter sp. NS-SX5 TaxID=3463854 RepID=UPI00405A15CC
MQKLVSSFLLLVVMGCSCKNTEKVNGQTAKEESLTNSSGLRLQKDPLNSQDANVRGEVSYTKEGLKPLSVLRFEGSEELKVKDPLWNEQFLPGSNEKKVVFWATEHHNDVDQFQLEEASLEDMRGFDFAPLIIQMKRMPPWEAGTFVQHYLYVPEGAKKRTSWTDGDLTYFFMPDSYQRDPSSHLPQYLETFPDYQLPSNKWGATSFFTANDLQSKALAKGYSYYGAFSAPPQKRIGYDYDEWLYKSGAPPAYSQTQEVVNDWLKKVDERTLLRNFKTYVIDRHANVGHLVLNWEALRFPYGPGTEKLHKALELWRKTYPQKTLSIWPHGLMGINRVNIEGNNYKYQLTKDLNFKGNLDQWYGQLSEGSPFYTNAFYKDNADINYIGGYLNYPTNYGYMHHLVMQHMMNKKFQPNKPSVLMWWHHQEYVGGFMMADKWFEGAKGEALVKKIKPMVFPSAMHNAAVWAFAFCDGGELWSEPYGRTDDKRYLGASTEVFDAKGRKIATQFGSQMTGQYAIQNYQNIDRWEGGKWSVSQNKDIIEANTKWEFVSSAREGERFTEGDQRLPSFSLYDHTPLVAVKYAENKKEALVLVYDAWNHPLKKEMVRVRIGSQVKEIEVFGEYTSVVRVKL